MIVVDEGLPNPPVPPVRVGVIIPAKFTVKVWSPSRLLSSIMLTSIQAVVSVPTGKLKSSEGAVKSVMTTRQQKEQKHL